MPKAEAGKLSHFSSLFIRACLWLNTSMINRRMVPEFFTHNPGIA
jgi:hypothetical protein